MKSLMILGVYLSQTMVISRSLIFIPYVYFRTVTVETISPISYAVIGIGVVLIVIAGVLITRRKA